MTEMQPRSHSLPAQGNHTIPVYIWEPAAEATAVIQIFHGLGEHSARYARFAQAAVDRGYAVCAHDHRGHGPQANAVPFFAPDNGWNLLVADGHQVAEFLQQEFARRPQVLLGHSMGSYIAQSYAMKFADELASLVLSGSTWPARPALFVGRLLARIISWRHGERAASPLLNKLGFGDFNKRFEPARTELDWLSRDADEVDAYVADNLCGGPYSIGLWLDLLGGLLDISTDEALRRIPQDLPILITGGAEDPVGGESGMNKLTAHYKASGHTRVSSRIYAGGRHEMLNETNRDEFTGELLTWIAASLPAHQS